MPLYTDQRQVERQVFHDLPGKARKCASFWPFWGLREREWHLMSISYTGMRGECQAGYSADVVHPWFPRQKGRRIRGMEELAWDGA